MPTTTTTIAAPNWSVGVPKRKNVEPKAELNIPKNGIPNIHDKGNAPNQSHMAR